MTRVLLFSLAAFLISAACWAQKPIAFGFAVSGISVSDNRTTVGTGYMLGVGVQRPIGNGRFRHHPNLTYGRYTDEDNYFFNFYDTDFESFSIRYDINVDIIKSKDFSYFLGGGLGANRSSGWIESLDLDKGYRYVRSQFTHSALFYSFLWGIRIEPEGGPFIEVIGMNFEAGFERYEEDGFEEGFSSGGALQVRIFIPLRRAAKKNE